VAHAATGQRRERDEAILTAPFGSLGISLEGGSLIGLAFMPPAPCRAPATALGAAVVAQLQQYFADKDFRFDLPLALRGTAFQRRVWRAIAAIPSGSTRSYGEIAADLGVPARAVGQACGDNPLPIVIPCHRVIGATGLGGFAHASHGFTIAVKRWLLEHEGALRGTLL
jgi:methylated-DNA-[protein]-cysteine S-methyltransferase